MPAAGVVMIVAVIVYFLVSTIVALRAITCGLDDAISGVVEIIAKTAPVEEVVDDINANLDAGVDLLEGLLVKKAGLRDAIGLIDGLYPGAGAQGLRNVPESGDLAPPRITTCAPHAAHTADRSSAASAWHSEPPIVPRLRTTGSAITRSASANNGNRRASSSERSSSTCRVSAPILIWPLSSVM